MIDVENTIDHPPPINNRNSPTAADDERWTMAPLTKTNDLIQYVVISITDRRRNISLNPPQTDNVRDTQP